MENTNKERLLYEIDKLEKIVNQLKFDFQLLEDAEFKDCCVVLAKKVKTQRLRIKAIEIKEKLKLG